MTDIISRATLVFVSAVEAMKGTFFEEFGGFLGGEAEEGIAHCQPRLGVVPSPVRLACCVDSSDRFSVSMPLPVKVDDLLEGNCRTERLICFHVVRRNIRSERTCDTCLSERTSSARTSTSLRLVKSCSLVNAISSAGMGPIFGLICKLGQLDECSWNFKRQILPFINFARPFFVSRGRTRHVWTLKIIFAKQLRYDMIGEGGKCSDRIGNYFKVRKFLLRFFDERWMFDT